MSDLTESKTMTEQKESVLTCVHQVISHLGYGKDSSQAYVIDRLLEDLPWVQVSLDEPGGEDAYMKARWDGRYEGTQNEVRAILGELCNYLPEAREQILRMTLREIYAPKVERDRKRKAHRDRFLPTLRRAIRAMGPRDRAILRVMHELRIAEHDLDAHFTDGWGRLVKNAPVNVLRDDLGLKELVSLFDVARSANRARD